MLHRIWLIRTCSVHSQYLIFQITRSKPALTEEHYRRETCILTETDKQQRGDENLGSLGRKMNVDIKQEFGHS